MTGFKRPDQPTALTLSLRWPIFLSAIIFSATICSAAENDQDVPSDWQQRLEMLRSVPYLGLSQSEAAKGDTGVVLHDADRTWPGYQLACRLSAGEAYLMDMEGRKVHRWRYPPGPYGGEDHAILLDNGDVVVIKKFSELARYDWNSDLIWRRRFEPHHDVALAPDGSFYVIDQEMHQYRDAAVSFDVLVHLSANGELIDRWSTHDHRQEIVHTLSREPHLDRIARRFQGRLPGSGSHGLNELEPNNQPEGLDRSEPLGRFDSDSAGAHGTDRRYEYFHMNTVGVLPDNDLGRQDDRFRPGHLLVCFRNINLIAVLEKDTYRLLWGWGEDELQWPHHPTMLPNGHILIFDNGIHREYSRIVELDPLREVLVWEYAARPPEDFYSPTRGSCQRLPNDNTLICESDEGRVFEITADGEMVWEWLNPAIIGGHRETVYRMIRLAPERVKPLLERWWWWGIDRNFPCN
jgi:hypothetical protein